MATSDQFDPCAYEFDQYDKCAMQTQPGHPWSTVAGALSNSSKALRYGSMVR